MVKKKEQPEGFETAQRTAEVFAKDKTKARYLLREAVEKAQKYRKALGSGWNDLQALLRLVRSWLHGEYTDVPWRTTVLAITAVVYFVNPFDVVPDFLPVTGLLDDATVIGFVIKSIKQDIERFLEWEGGNVLDSPSKAN